MAEPIVPNPFRNINKHKILQFNLFESEIIKIAANSFHMIRQLEHQLEYSLLIDERNCFEILKNNETVKDLIKNTNEWYRILATQKGGV